MTTFTLAISCLTNPIYLDSQTEHSRFLWITVLYGIIFYFHQKTQPHFHWASFLLWYLWICAKSFQLCPNLCDSMDSSPPGSSVHGLFQARILEWVAMSSSRGSSWPRNRTRICCVSCIAGTFFTHWGTWEAPAKDIAGLLGGTQKTDSTFSFWWISFYLVMLRGLTCSWFLHLSSVWETKDPHFSLTWPLTPG